MSQPTKPRLSFWQIWNMSFGFLGIQFGFALQGGNMSRIFQTLGAGKDEIPLLWIAAPLTGLLVQPIIGYLSDRTWHVRLGRRRPYFLLGAILSSITLVFVPHSPELWVAAGCLWMLDASINISMEPFRALVADKLPEEQRSYGFVIQTLIIGIGTWIASNLPWMVSLFGVSNEAAAGVVPDTVKIAFSIGAAVFLGSVLFTIVTTTEYPPEDMDEFEKEKANSGFLDGLKEIFSNIASMPMVMKKLGLVQFFSWFAFFTMWSFATPALTEHVFNTPDPSSLAYQESANLVSSYMGTYGLSSMVFALILSFIAGKMRINRKLVHMLSLIIGGVGFIYMYFITNHVMLHVSFACIGIAWGSILSMPYAMLSGSIDDKKMGLFMGLFNMFIVIPQIVAALGGVNWAYQTLLGEETINTMILAGICLILAGLSNLLITEKEAIL
ncbi:MAG: maltose/moltooligosaccharide transporter [Bacteroidia bacterium]|jgi:maltose/moltooligosaccharide transporter